MTETPEKPRRGAGRIAFLAHAEEFQKLVNAGYSVLAIYENHQGQLGISYSQFARYVAKYLRMPGYEQKAK